MDRLLRLIPLDRRLDRRVLRAGAEALFWAAVVAALHLLGPHVPTDWVDLLVGVALVGFAVTSIGPPLGFTLPRLAVRLARRAGSRLELLFDTHYGADFHPEREPRLPQLTRYRRLITLIVGADIALAISVAFLGSPLLALLRASYVLYLAGGALVWLGLAVALTSLVLTFLQQLRLIPGRGRRALGRRRIAGILFAVAAGSVSLVVLDDLVGAGGWITMMAAALLVLLPPRLGPPVEFRLNLRLRTSEAPRLETTTVEEMVRSFLAVLVLTALGLSLIIQGHRLPFAAHVPEMAARLPIAHHTGRALAWIFALGTFTNALLYAFEFTVRRRRSDPACRGPVAADRDQVVALAVSNLELARSGRRDRGEGFLFAPHWWPSDRMYRDSWPEDDLGEGAAGPDFHRHYGQPPRRLLRRLLRALAIDLIYIEDGVPAARLGDVMQFLFTHYDRSGGETGTDQVLEERHLTSPPGVHLALQEIEIDTPRRKLDGEYREPSYESLSRARLLLVLRLRGGEDESPSDDPFAFTREPGWVDRFLSRVGPVMSGV